MAFVLERAERRKSGGVVHGLFFFVLFASSSPCQVLRFRLVVPVDRQRVIVNHFGAWMHASTDGHPQRATSPNSIERLAHQQGAVDERVGIEETKYMCHDARWQHQLVHIMSLSKESKMGSM